ncbi:MAG: hypothetical protein ACFFE8_09775 [Candidatus Heimdallarchaeota archaeon]
MGYHGRFKRRRAQIRAVDFIVSLLLFMLMLSQLILIIVTIQAGIQVSTSKGITAEEIDVFARSILLEEGEPGWGYRQILPATFGLGSDISTVSLTLDPAKIARLVTGTDFPVFQISGYSTFDYTALKEAMHLPSGRNFQLALLPTLETSVEVAVLNINNNTNIITVETWNARASPISSAKAYFFVVDFTTGTIHSLGVSITDTTGQASKNYLIPNAGIPDAEHMVLSIVEKGALWGMNWAYIDPNPAFSQSVIGTASSSTVWGGGINSTALLASDQVIETPDQHYISILYRNTVGGFSNTTLDLSSSISGNATIPIPTNGLVIVFSISQIGDTYEVAIGSYPTILDRTQTTGVFYDVFGAQEDESSAESQLSRTYPVIVRNLLMKCTITLWSE